MKGIHCILIYACLQLVIVHSIAQTEDSVCLKIYDGYITRIFEKWQPATVGNSDVFFSITKPNVKLYANDKYVTRLIDADNYLVNEQFYEDANLVQGYASNIFRFYYASPAFDSVVTEAYSVFVYRVMLSGFKRNEKLEKYIAMKKQPHFQSGLRHLHNEKRVVLYPHIIVCW